MRQRLVKLVRDDIAQFVGDSTIEYKQIDDPDEYIKLLRGKLVEEAVEYILSPSVDELADIFEVIKALAKNDLNVSLTDVYDKNEAKFDERGGFEDGIGMYCLTTAGAEHEGDKS
jgi:predicted house-cleaning noncanonical NTP pyrophosphatase (MazG superfamily)